VGTVRELETGRLVTLDAHTVVGRAPHCAIRLADPLVSGDHASLKWAKTQWMVRDLGSTNGTWLNGSQIPKGQDVALDGGSELCFGSQTPRLLLVDALAPEPVVTPLLGGPPCTLQEGVISIPSVQRPGASIFQGADGTWTLEAGERVVEIAPGAVFDALGTSWRFSCPTQWQPTTPLHSMRLLAGSSLHLVVTRDEERAKLTVDTGRELVTLGESSIYYLLVTLARIRLQDHGRRPAAESGWVHREQLVRMLQCDPSLLNVWVCRIRSKLSVAGFVDYASIIERRDGAGYMRLGVADSVIERA
jgi:hypothetical protein